MPARIKKLQHLIFVILLIFLPTQIGLHFWPSWAFVNGVRVDYFSPTLYLTDVLIFILVMLNLFQHLKQARPGRAGVERSRNKFGMTQFIYCVTGLLILLNISFSLSPFVTFYKWIKVAELVFLAWYINQHKINLRWLIIPVVYEFVLVFWQFINQSSAGLWWYWLGERSFNLNTPGIATVIINGQNFLRPYGTFSHPNVLGGWMAVVFGLLVEQRSKFFALVSALMSFSRAAILSLGFYVNKKLVILGLLGVLGLLIGTQSWNVRLQLDSLAVQKFVQSPIIGTGLGTSPLYHRDSSSNYALTFQPIHNIYLLVLAETGVLGEIIFLILLFWAWKKAGKYQSVLLVVLFLGVFDHYFITLQQGQLLFTLLIGIISQ